MNTPPTHLVDGYRRFRNGRYRDEAARYKDLADGQSPRTMIIACADSRVDPATIFGVAPGELFVVRNVANLVPPCSTKPTDLHGTSAALEFAVCGLNVKDIVIMGHGDCGGINASLAVADNRAVGQFIAPWVALLSTARDKVIDDPALSDHAARQAALEHEGICLSLNNLMSFPFVEAAVSDGQLALHGAWFSIGSGELQWFNEETSRFENLVEGYC